MMVFCGRVVPPELPAPPEELPELVEPPELLPVPVMVPPVENVNPPPPPAPELLLELPELVLEPPELLELPELVLDPPELLEPVAATVSRSLLPLMVSFSLNPVGMVKLMPVSVTLPAATSV